MTPRAHLEDGLAPSSVAEVKMTVLLRVENLTKRFPGVLANDQLNLEIRAGEIHSLLGENGAGKSTLMNILYGLYEPDEGSILWKGAPLNLKSPREAIGRGIGMVHQHFMLIPTLTVLENIVLGLHAGLRADMAAAEAKVLQLAEEFQQPIDPHAKVGDLSVGQQQRVEIMKALYRDAELLILDEPTAVLTPQEAQQLFTVCRKLAQRGKAVIFIAHKLSEILSLSNRVTVLRAGRSIATLDTSECSPPQLARLMVGQDVSLTIEKAAAKPGRPVLEVRGLSVTGDNGKTAVEQLSLTVHEGEVIGIAGVDGNGQTELVEAIVGLRRAASGSVLLDGVEVTNLTLANLMERGVALVPADRHAAALVSDFNLVDNALLGFEDDPRFAARGMLALRKVQALAEDLIRNYHVKTPSAQIPIKNLSGGNQQRFVMARAMSHDPRLLVVVQPTRGLDIASSEFVRRKIIELRDSGRAVILVSMDLDEILMMSDRIEVMHHGRIMGSVGPDAGRDQIGLLMAGATPDRLN